MGFGDAAGKGVIGQTCCNVTGFELIPATEEQSASDGGWIVGTAGQRHQFLCGVQTLAQVLRAIEHEVPRL